MNNFNNNEKEVLVSVIIPCYNCEKTIEKTLISLENQTFNNFEVIIINDGCSDNSDKVIQEYIKSSKIRYNYIIQENSGVSSARNKGIYQSKGKYIMFLDADDIYHKDCIKVLVDEIKSKNVDTVYSCYSRNVEKILNEELQDESEIKKIKLTHKELLNNFMYRKGPCCFTNYIYKKSILIDNNILFTSDIKYGEDLEFVWKYLTHCKDGVFIDRAYYGYFDNPTSAVNTISWNQTDIIYVTQRVEEYLRKNNDDFVEIYNSYMYHRVIWALLKDFSRAGKKDLFNKLILEQDTKKSMKIMSNNGPNSIIKITAKVFCINPKLFYNIFKLI